uniref:PAP_central domain-containing protein n=1 Tax=Meloidogyne hapla TaxID=6305 RepID=A0A1I8BCH1_MELHA
MIKEDKINEKNPKEEKKDEKKEDNKQNNEKNRENDELKNLFKQNIKKTYKWALSSEPRNKNTENIKDNLSSNFYDISPKLFLEEHELNEFLLSNEDYKKIIPTLNIGLQEITNEIFLINKNVKLPNIATNYVKSIISDWAKDYNCTKIEFLLSGSRLLNTDISDSDVDGIVVLQKQNNDNCKINELNEFFGNPRIDLCQNSKRNSDCNDFSLYCILCKEAPTQQLRKNTHSRIKIMEFTAFNIKFDISFVIINELSLKSPTRDWEFPVKIKELTQKSQSWNEKSEIISRKEQYIPEYIIRTNEEKIRLEKHSDLIMVVLTIGYPEQNCLYNVNYSTKQIIKKELENGIK